MTIICFEIFQEVVDVVRSGHGDLEGFVPGDEGGQLGQALLAGAADSHQHHVAAGVPARI